MLLTEAEDLGGRGAGVRRRGEGAGRHRRRREGSRGGGARRRRRRQRQRQSAGGRGRSPPGGGGGARAREADSVSAARRREGRGAEEHRSVRGRGKCRGKETGGLSSRKTVKKPLCGSSWALSHNLLWRFFSAPLASSDFSRSPAEAQEGKDFALTAPPFCSLFPTALLRGRLQLDGFLRPRRLGSVERRTGEERAPKERLHQREKCPRSLAWPPSLAPPLSTHRSLPFQPGPFPSFSTDRSRCDLEQALQASAKAESDSLALLWRSKLRPECLSPRHALRSPPSKKNPKPRKKTAVFRRRSPPPPAQPRPLPARGQGRDRGPSPQLPAAAAEELQRGRLRLLRRDLECFDDSGR